MSGDGFEIFWFLPTGGDGRYLGTDLGGREATPGYLRQVAIAVDQAGYSGMLLPTGIACEDAWVTAAALIPETDTLRFLVAVRPGLNLPGVAARMTATLDRFARGRLLINVVTGGDPVELAGEGIHLGHDERYAVTDEFLAVWRKLLAGERVVHKGAHFDIDGGQLHFAPVQRPHPPLYFGGSSPAGIEVAARHCDVYLTWGEPPETVAQKLDAVRAAFARQGRAPRFGIRLHVIVRETDAAAWEAAEDLIRHLDDDTIARAQANLSRQDSVGQSRMFALHGGRRDRLEVSPNLWAGVGLVRSGAGTALVGGPETVAERMREYADLGIETFILSGYPHLEEALRFSELVFPHLPLAAAEPARPRVIGHRGEFVGNAVRPELRRSEG